LSPQPPTTSVLPEWVYVPFLLAGMLLAGIGVVLGAWGAHGLEAYQLAHFGTADPSSWKTAVLYQFVHALALLAIGGVGLHRTGGV